MLLLTRFIPFMPFILLGAVAFYLIFGGIGDAVEGAFAGFVLGLVLFLARIAGFIGRKAAPSARPTDR